MSARGQAVVELSLGLLVFTGALMLTLHLAELGALALRAEQLTHTALWDASAYRAERFGRWNEAARVSVPSADAALQRHAAKLSGARWSFTRTAAVEGRCTRAGLGFPVSALVRPFDESGGTRCSASIVAETPGLPASFSEGAHGFFRAALSVRQLRRVCGAGRDGRHGCPGGFQILQGDHGLTDGPEANECALAPDSPASCANPAFYDVTRDTWDRSMGFTGAPERFARHVAGDVPNGRITGFYLSFRGEESYFAEAVGGESWQTSPMDGRHGYRESYNLRSACSRAGASYCYLGVTPCD